MTSPRVLVTGGAGFVGSNLCVQLRARHPDWELVAADNLYRGGSELNLPRLAQAGVAFARADVRAPADLDAIGDFTALVECSAEPSVMAGADVVVPVNLVGAFHCFEAARERAAQVVFLSTSRVYPVRQLEALRFTEAATRFELDADQDCPGASADGISEDFPLNGRRTMYGASKLAAELLLAEYDMPWVIDRCGVIAGPWQMGKVDQGVFTHWVLSHHLGRPLSYFGYGGEGKQVRDLLHVDDLVDLVDRQLTDPAHWAGHTFNVGGGREGSLSLAETTTLCQELTGVSVPIGAVPERRAGDVRCYLSDCRRLFAHTDWRPTLRPAEVVGDIARWVADHEALVRDTL
ncbi:MAG: NAD-dependent epimerase/dehydratase family protein [Acidimicrobiales bacterium]